MRGFEIVMGQEKPKGAPSCLKCARLITDGGMLRCSAGRQTLIPCGEFKDASIDRTVRRGIKNVGYPL